MTADGGLSSPNSRTSPTTPTMVAHSVWGGDESEPPAQSVTAREVAPDEGLVDHHHGRRAGAVRRLDAASPEQRDAKRLEESWGDHAVLDDRLVGRTVVGFALDGEEAVRAIARER